MRMTRAFVATATATALVLGGVSAPAFAEDGQSSNPVGSATGGSSTLNNLSNSLTGSSQATKNVSDATVKGTQGVDSGSAKISGLSSGSSDDKKGTNTNAQGTNTNNSGNDLSAQIPGGPVGAAIGVIILLMLLNGGKNGQGGLDGISSTISSK